MDRGFIRTILVIVIALAILYYFFDWSILDAKSSPRGEATVDYLANVFWASIEVVKKYIIAPIVFIFRKVIGNL